MGRPVSFARPGYFFVGTATALGFTGVRVIDVAFGSTAAACSSWPDAICTGGGSLVVEAATVGCLEAAAV